jgi:UDP-N-acetylglucosamine 4,6-dehydratase
MKGGEIFIPKLPSMRITDVARTVAPGLKHEIVGIRPGEKLHECLLSEDESRATMELDDRYVITPPSPEWSDAHLTVLGGHPVVEGFEYSSNHNTEWLDASTLANWISKLT